MKKVLFLFFVFFVLNKSNAQQKSSTCNFKLIKSVSVNKDSIDFVYYLCENIDVKDEDCLYIMAEGYENEVPSDSSKLLIVFFIESEEQFNSINYTNLFKGQIKSNYRNKVKLIYLYDVKSGFSKSFFNENELNEVFGYDVFNKDFKFSTSNIR
jgi:hypothetical protein